MKRTISVAMAAVLGAALLVTMGAGTADAGKNWWVSARVHHKAIVEEDGFVAVDVTYRCRLPHGRSGSSEVLSILTQRPDARNEYERMDVDEFSCGVGPQTVQQGYSSDYTPFRPGRATLTLVIRVCTGDVTDDPGNCMHKRVVSKVWLRPGVATSPF